MSKNYQNHNKKTVNENPSGLSARQLYRTIYKPFITKQVIDRFPTPSYSSTEGLLDTWQKHVPATPEIAEELLVLTRTFITLPNYQVMKNPQYLKALIKDIASYLAEYFMRFEKKQVDAKNRNIAKEKLMTKLYDEFGLVQQRIIEHAEHAEESKQKKAERQQAIKNGTYVPKHKRYNNSSKQLRKTGVPTDTVAQSAQKFSQTKTQVLHFSAEYNCNKK